MTVRKFSGFNSSGADEVTLSEANVSKVKKEPKFFDVGLHTVKIVSVEEKGSVSTDQSWERLWIKVEGTGGKSTYCGAMFPTESLLFKGEANTFVAKTFKSLVLALGYDASERALPGVLTKLFSDTSKLEGLELQVQIGYKGNHLVMKDKKLHLVQKYGRPIMKDGEPAVFSEREEASEWAAANNLELQKFPEVVAFIPAEKLATPVIKKTSETRAAF